MGNDPIELLVKIGFSEYEAKAYVALLRKSPVSGYELSKLSEVPRSMIYEVAAKLKTRGAVMILRTGGATKYAAVPSDAYLDQLHREYHELISSSKKELSSLTSIPDLDYVWNIEGRDNIMAKAVEMIDQAKSHVYLSLVPTTFPFLRPALERAIERGVRVVVYSTDELDLPGGQVVVAHVAQQALEQARGLGLILAVDGAEVLVGEWLADTQARASWASSPLLVFITEHHLRTDLYLPEVLALLGDKALEIIQEEDYDLFAQALESHIDR
jgi:sugar-specific transcriptional regulator TrmB